MDVSIKYYLSQGFYFIVTGEVLIEGHNGHPFQTDAYIKSVIFTEGKAPGLIVDHKKIDPKKVDKIKAAMISAAQKITKHLQEV